MARVGGAVFPKQFQQFEAIGVHNGPDGKPDTEDDWTSASSTSKWTIEEYTATFGDDDMQFVGAIDQKRPVHAERRRSEPEAQPAIATTSATSGSSPS